MGLSILSFFTIFLVFGSMNVILGDVRFDDSYIVTWGHDHVLMLNQGSEVQLSMDEYSGAGFGSKVNYGSGYFHMRIKLPNRDSSGVVTAFYLASNTNDHDELDFEFLGNKEGKPITLQTNVFVKGKGEREQRTLLWFDPTADFHTYSILWNQHQVVFYVDNIPIRVFKNNENIGVPYPTQAMQIQGSLWDGESWATDGGKTKTNWSFAPFTAHFQGFDVDACSTMSNNCDGSEYWWNERRFWELDESGRRLYEEVRGKYMNYDYCDDRERHPVTPPECASNMYIN